MTQGNLNEEEAIEHVVVRMNAVFTGVVLGLICGIGVFAATLWLVIKGGPHPGAHLVLLSQYFSGYTVSWGGCFVGFGYAFLFGFLTGSFLGFVYNRLARQ